MNGNRVRIGGVTRCCLDQEWPDDPKEGDTLNCQHCSPEGQGDHGLRFREGAWEARWIGDEKEARSAQRTRAR